MDLFRRAFYIYCKECNQDIVETPNLYGLCSACKKTMLKPRYVITVEKITAFLHTCEDTRKNEILAQLLILNNCIPTELSGNVKN